MAAAAALVLVVVFAVVALGLRSAIQIRRTGDSGFRGLRGDAPPAEKVAGVLLVLAAVGLVAAPVLALIGAVDPIPALAVPAVVALGAAFMLAGTAGTLWAQLAMGDSWRIGVDPDEDTTLVSRGPFSRIRNPIFTAMMLGAIGLALMVPSVVGLAVPVVLAAALELQVRVVEEPYLLATHGAQYADYARRTGRFVPGLGRLG